VNGGTIVFDGEGDYITSSFATTSVQAVTYCGWLYSTETGSTTRYFLSAGAVGRPDIRFISGQIQFDTSFGYVTPEVYVNQWVYVVLSKPAGNPIASYYVNGVLVGTGTSVYNTGALTPYLFNRLFVGSTAWKGNCSILQVYNRALTAAEVLQNFNATRGRYGI
jgi:hypothetical protein